MFLPLTLVACHRLDPGVHVLAPAALIPVVTDAVAFLDDDRVSLLAKDDPIEALGDMPRDDLLDIALVADLDCGECFRVDRGDAGFVVHGGGALGVQYGLADVLERHGWRFFHPWRTVRPATVTLIDADGLGVTETPEQALRGLHPHTLHPIEALFDLWVPSADGLAGSKRMVDWLIKNRGNHIQWPGLDDVVTAAAHDAWKPHTRAILDYAHLRGVRTGIGIQLFGGSNLQLAYDLLDDGGQGLPEQQSAMDARLHLVLDDLPFDAVNLSFGEFSGEDPAAFLDSLNLATARVHALAPAAEVSAVVHVGEMEDLYVEWEGERMIYYFLVKYADPSIVPYIHTVMYYNLFEDAGLAYNHERFDAHRAWLEERLAADQPVVYFPESAYWVAFDNPVPTWLPLYVRSRWYDMDQLRAQGLPLGRHVLFSSGWEWGYWQNDLATLRFGWELPADWRASFDWMYAPWGNPEISASIADLVDAQHDALIDARLAPWMGGRDTLMDVGRAIGIVSQPDRASFEEIVAMSVEDRAALRATAVEPLAAHGAATRAVLARLPLGDDWLAELVDGAEIDALRAEYMAGTLDALLLHADGDAAGATAALDAAVAAMERARVVVARRHANLHDPDGDVLIGVVENPTIYDYGYLHQADTLCFWERERVQADAIVRGVEGVDPGCVL